MREKQLAFKAPKEIEFDKLDIEWGKKKGGSLTGNEAEECLKSNITNICYVPPKYRKDGDFADQDIIIIGNKRLQKLAKLT